MPDQEARPKDPTPRKRYRLKAEIVPLNHDLDQQGTYAESPEDRHLRLERYHQLHHALAKIPPPGRELLEMRYGFNGPPLTLRELARARGVSEEAVRQKIDRLLKRLKIYLRRREVRETRKIQTALSARRTPRTKQHRPR
jgi:RNA polymerase sigma factor (sigma-70 family)